MTLVEILSGVAFRIEDRGNGEGGSWRHERGDMKTAVRVQVVGAALGVDLRFPACGQSSRHGAEDGSSPKNGGAPGPGDARLQESERLEKWSLTA